jgi:hypothetical protein
MDKKQNPLTRKYLGMSARKKTVLYEKKAYGWG